MNLLCRWTSLIAALLLMGWCVTLRAGPVTIETSELPKLRALLASDKDAAEQFDELKELADSALGDKPNPVPTVKSAGLLATDPAKIRTVKSLEDMQKAEALAWVSVVTGEPRYAAKGREFIAAWAKVNKADGNAINETAFEPMIDAYDILRDGFDPRMRSTVDKWLRSKVDLLWQDTFRQRENWQSHRLKTIGIIALTLHDDAMWSQVDKAYKAHMQANFDASGKSIDFSRRDAMHYHVYATRPLLTLACASARAGDDLFDYRAPNGANLGAAVEFVSPYATRSKRHVEFAQSAVGFDKKRAKAGEDGFDSHAWRPGQATTMYSEGGCLKPEYDKMASQVSQQPSKRYISWRSVLNTAAPAPAQR